MTGLLPLNGLRLAYVAFIAMASILALHSGLAGAGEGHHPAGLALFLAGTELVAALALLAPAVERIACGVLLLVFVIACAVSVTSGDLLAPFRFLYYALTAVLIVVADRRSGGKAATESFR